MVLSLVRVVATVGLLAFHGVSADASSDSGSESGLRGATCEKQLEKVLAELQKAQQIQLDEMPEAPSGTHWPASKEAYVPPLVQYWFELHQWLQVNNHQWAVAAVAGVLGLINLVNGPTSFKTMLMLIFSLVAGACMHYEVTLLWPELDFVLQAIAVAEAVLLTGFVAYYSTEGCQAILGLGLGLGVSAVLEPLFHTETWPLNHAVIWYSAWAFFGVLSLTVFQKRTLALFSPALGGFLLSSCLGYEIKLVAWASSQQQGNEQLPSWVVIHGDCWLDFARTLLPNSPVSAGIFEIIPTPGFTAFKEIDVDRVLGRLLWFVLFYAGLRWQMWCAKKASVSNSSLKESLIKKKKKPAY